MDPLRLISQYFWIALLVMSAVNYVIARRRMHSSLMPAQLPEALRYLCVFAVAGALPWVVMGIGALTGMTPTIWQYFRPQDLNPFVIAWLACLFILAVAYAIWVLAMGSPGSWSTIRPDVRNQVVESINNASGDHCVDVFVRDDGSFGFEEFRRDHEDQRGWFSLRRYSSQSFATLDAALQQARLSIAWMADSTP